MRVASIDRVGHRSDWATSSAIAEAHGAGEDDEAPSGKGIDGGVATSANSAGEPQLELYAEWVGSGEAEHDRISITSSLFPSNAAEAAPGEPFVEKSKSCYRSTGCGMDAPSAYRIGVYKTLTEVVVLDNGTETQRTSYWSGPTTIEPLDGGFVSPEVPGNGEPIDTTGVRIDEPEADGDETVEEEVPGGASTAGAKVNYAACYTKRDVPPPLSDFKVDDPKPRQHRCRHAFKITDVDGSPGITKHDYLRDFGVEAYAPTRGTQRQPRSLRMKRAPIFKFEEEKPNPAKPGETMIVTTRLRGWPMLDSLGFTRAWVRSYGKRVGKKDRRRWQIYRVADQADPTVTKQRSAINVKGNTDATKLQGRACYRPIATTGPGAETFKQRNKKTNKIKILRTLRESTVSLFKIDFGASTDRVRFFVPNAAFAANPKVLHKTHVGCARGSSNVKVDSAISDVLIPGRESVPTEDPNIKIFREFAFKEGPGGGNGLGKTFTTYNPKSKYGVRYVFANTNSVEKGGVARGIFPIDGTFQLMGFTGYCDVNAYTKTTTKRYVRKRGKGGSYVKDKNGDFVYVWKTNVKMDGQQGMQWGYGRHVFNGQPIGLYGWIPFASLPGLDAGPGDEPLGCNYGPMN